MSKLFFINFSMLRNQCSYNFRKFWRIHWTCNTNVSEVFDSCILNERTDGWVLTEHKLWISLM